MRAALSVLITGSLAAIVSAQSYEWRQSPITGRLYAVTQPMTWQQARSQALATGGDLAVVRDAGEQDWLFDQFGGLQALWIGYTDEVTEGTWLWVSGANPGYTNWAPGQPDNQGGAENWAAMSPQNGLPLGAGGRWLDLDASFVCPGIIELDPGAAGRVTSLGSGCPGSNGAPSVAPLGGAPVPGSLSPVRFDNLPLAPTVVFVGIGLPGVPIDLGPFGMPGCQWFGDQFYLTLLLQPASTGALNWSFAVLNSPILRGVQLRLQGLVTDPPANARGATVTNELVMYYGQDLGEISMCESFLDDAMLDRDKSGGEWAGGSATFAPIGGDGVHGSFSAVGLGAYLGQFGGLDTYLIDTDGTVIPPQNTLTGSAVVVTDGRFSFDEMVVPANVRLRFAGSSPPVFTVAGRIEIRGEIDAQGETLPYPASSTAPLGQTGGAAGIFGGRGGNGGDKATGNGPSPTFDGEDGESAHVLAGRAYAATANGTGGRGSTIFPASGLNSALFFGPGIVTYTPTASAGGGGGGLWAAGNQSTVTNNHIDPNTGVPPLLSALGPPAAGGTALQFFPFPAASGSTRSSVHFVVGGSGGGAAASNAALSLNVVRVWAAGCGGGGGGGAVGLRAGDVLDVDPGASILASGGSAGSIVSTFGTAAPAPAGGGSGGSVLLQSGNTANVAGTIDVRGGLGGTYDRQAGGAPPTGARVQIAGGDGSPGAVRFELPVAPSTAMLPNMLPAPVAGNVGALTEVDQLGSSTSRLYDTRVDVATEPAPRFLRYEIEALVDGVPVVFSDDPAVSTMTAGAGAPLRAYFQGAQLDPVTGQVLVWSPWRSSVRGLGGQLGLADDIASAFRLRLVADRGLASSVEVTSVKVVYTL